MANALLGQRSGYGSGKDVTVALLARSRVCMPRKQSLMRLHVV